MNNKIIKRLLPKLPLIIIAVITIYPFIWMLITSIKFETDIVKFPPTFFASAYSFNSYAEIWKRIPFLSFYKNTIIFAGGVTILSLLFDSMAGYAFARLNFKGRNFLFILILATLMVPFQVIMIPLFIEISKMGLINTFIGLILPRASNAFGVFMMRQFFLTLPKELEEAARIDGCSEFKIYWKIMLPLCKPALISLGIFHFMYNWNDLLYPLLLTNSSEMRTIPAGIALFVGQNRVLEYAFLMTGACLALAPILIAYIVAQRYFIKGIATIGIKG